MTLSWDITLWLDDIETVDHSELGVSRLIWQYRGDQARVQALLTTFLNRLQSLEDVAIDVLANRWPLTAEGVQLDAVGKIVGQLRGRKTDDEYRIFIAAKILINKSKGRATEIGDIISLIGFPTIDIIEYKEAEILVSVAGHDYGEDIGPFVALASPAGVRFRWTFSDYDADETFQFSATLSSDDTDAATGFGDLEGATQTTGGYFAGGI